MDIITALAMPLSWLYGLGTGIRNLLYDSGLLTSRTFSVPVLSVGNIAVGGTGKTPHTEYLIRLLQPTHKVCVLSRGYRRKSKGFQLATSRSTTSQLGDEPMQMHQKYPDAIVAVDKDRCHGIDMLTDIQKADRQDKPMVVLLDDAFQHRRVKPTLSILLTDYHRLYHTDHLMPAGRLRESSTNAARADIIIVTKCPDTISSTEQSAISQNLNLKNWQQLFFTTFRYSSLPSGQKVLLVTGIANPRPLADKLREQDNDVTELHFADHHDYTPLDIEVIKHKANDRIIVTTEKDAVKLREFASSGLTFTVAAIEVAFLNNKEEEFNNIILNHANTGIR